MVLIFRIYLLNFFIISKAPFYYIIFIIYKPILYIYILYFSCYLLFELNKVFIQFKWRNISSIYLKLIKANTEINRYKYINRNKHYVNTHYKRC